jgi:uncharacterized protein (TIGR02145 family)
MAHLFKLIAVPLLSCSILWGAQGQNSITLTYTGINDGIYQQLGSIHVRNITQGGDTTLYYPDTVLVLNYVGINDMQGDLQGFRVDRNFPNPVTDRSTFGVCLPHRDILDLEVTDLLGRRLITEERGLGKGYHTFSFIPGPERIYFVTASCGGKSTTLKILNAGQGQGRTCSLQYEGPVGGEAVLKGSSVSPEFLFSPGDMLLCIGSAEGIESSLVDAPETSRDYVFQFATNIPCPGLDSIYYEEQWYHTIQILSQCWLKENLNAGTMILGTQQPSDNGIIEKYCFANGEMACDAKGGLYLWEEVMQYVTNEGTQGICPPGWHVPSDEEFKILEGAADSQYGMGHGIWNSTGFRGYDVAVNLKSVNGWYSNGNGTDLYGFRALPTGYWYQNAFFEYNEDCGWWTSSSNSSVLPWYRGMNYQSDAMARMVNTFGPFGAAVRCVKD